MANQVLKIIKQRHHSGSKPSKRDDPYKIALTIEGGGLRGVVGIGASSALEALNFREAFDVVYGSSSGAYTASFFVAGEALSGAPFFLDYSQKQLVSIKRFLRGGSLFDLDYARQEMHSDIPLNYHRAMHYKPPLHLVATDATRSRPIIIKNFKTAEELDRALKASSTIPPFHHPKPLLFRSHHYLDAAFLDPFCLNSAINEKNTHIMVLFTAAWQHRHELPIFDRKLVKPYLNKINTHLAEMYLHHGEYSVNGLSHVWNHYDGTHILALAPAKNIKLPGQLTKNRRRLAKGFLAGAEAVLHNFAPDEHTKKVILENFKRELKI